MKLRNYLLLANLVSITAMVAVLLVFYNYMLVSTAQLIWLMIAALAAGCASALLHFIMMRPVERAVHRLGAASTEFASGHLFIRVPVAGSAELKQLAEQFNVMGEKLENSFEQIKASEQSRRELVANLAHDLRTPLAAVQSYVEALEDGVVQDEETVRRYLATIRQESIRLGGLIRSLMELSTMDGTERKHEAVPVLMDDILMKSLTPFSKALESKGLELDVKLPDQPLYCRVVPDQVQRILQNLLENAIRYSPPHGVISIAAGECSGPMLCISVADQGPGIPDQEKERIFERFYRIDRSRNRAEGGAGLGLAIAKSFVLEQKGEIGVKDRPGGGSIFWFTLPKLSNTIDEGTHTIEGAGKNAIDKEEG